ncbi:biotin synthase [bacterium BMS3Bbin11]|nr:biotin synthase [bacterium BMS3Abin11]GBE45619.1 biotin synthase [bacterium BMS3Bbin11]GMT40251.1 MAG: biotin synthase [bacterium]
MASTMKLKSDLRHDWRREEVQLLFDLPLNDLLFQAQTVHRQNFDANAIQLSTLLNIKTGACAEDCSYCSQSVVHDTSLKVEPLMDEATVMESAREAKRNGASRFCMGAAWRTPTPKGFKRILEIIRGVKSLGLETCATLGMLTSEQAHQLKQAGLDYYNHNLDTSAEYYDKVITTRTYQDRLDTLSCVRDAGMKVCCGGIVGMGEEQNDRVGLLMTLANLEYHPESVPVNLLVKIEGTPLAETEELDIFEFTRCIAVARILMPASLVRLSAGRQSLSDEAQAMCFLAGANSIFYGERLLTTDNPEADSDRLLFERLGLYAMESGIGAETVSA